MISNPNLLYVPVIILFGLIAVIIDSDLFYIRTIILCGSLSAVVYELVRQEQALKEAENKLSEMKNNVSTYGSDNKVLNGIFEVHITVKPKKNYTTLLKYIEENRHERKFKLVFAVSGKNNQYMLSYFTRKDDDKLAVESALQTAENLKKEGISVTRVKIEAHDVRGLPLSNKDYEDMSDHLNLKYNRKCGKPYFEFHCKISPNDQNYLEDLENDVKKFDKCAISYNLCSSNKNPILTIRIYDVGFVNAEKYKDEVMNSLKKLGHIFEDKIQEEFSIFDSNPGLDEGFISNQF